MASRSGKKVLELTLGILKPDLTAHPHAVREVKSIVKRNNFFFVREKVLSMSHNRAAKFYAEHEGKFFHNRLVTYMASGPITTFILARENAIKEWRKLLGPTKVYKTVHEAPGSLRGRFGLTDTRNSAHGSDSPISSRNEILFFFPEFDIEKWYKEEEETFRLHGSNIIYDDTQGIHKVKSAS